MKKALISVSDKTGIVEIAKAVAALGYGLLSTGGTAKTLREAGLDVQDVSEITGFPACLGGRVKTLHPRIHAGILARRDIAEDMEFLQEQNIDEIGLVIVNLYPFRQTILREDCDLPLAVENIDIGGPSMLRAAAKNYPSVTVLCDPADYDEFLQREKENRNDETFRMRLSAKVYRHCAFYDSMVSNYLSSQVRANAVEQAKVAVENNDETDRDYWLQVADSTEDTLTLAYERVSSLRYGENPHQRATYYKEALPVADSLTSAVQLQGKELSYNNLMDANAAIEIIKDFQDPTVVALKHANPCGVASADNILDAWEKAYESDTVSIFGGIVCSNREIDKAMAEEMRNIFLEVVIAPSYTEEAKEIFSKKKNLRLLVLPEVGKPFADQIPTIRQIHGGLLVQERDTTDFNMEDVHVVTEKGLEPGDFAKIRFAMRCVKHVKSNGICLTKDFQTIGIGPGQPNRITSVEIACTRAGEKTRDAIMASDAFFPFDDCVRYAAEHGIRLIVQPGGSVRDDESIAACNELGICMVFTGQRHFKH